MIPLTINLDGDNAWPDLVDKQVILPASMDGAAVQLALLDNATKQGRPAVTIRIDLADGRVVLAETTARLFVTAARLILTRHPKLLD